MSNHKNFLTYRYQKYLFGLLYIFTGGYVAFLAAARIIVFCFYLLSESSGPILIEDGNPMEFLLNYLRLANSKFCIYYAVAYVLLCILICLFSQRKIRVYVWHTFLFFVLPFPVLYALNSIFSIFTVQKRVEDYARPGLVITNSDVWRCWIAGFVLMLIATGVNFLYRLKQKVE